MTDVKIFMLVFIGTYKHCPHKKEEKKKENNILFTTDKHSTKTEACKSKEKH